MVATGCLASIPGVESSWPWTWLDPRLTVTESALAAIQAAQAGLPQVTSPQFPVRLGYHSGYASRADAQLEIRVDLGSVQALDALVIIPAYTTQEGPRPYGFPPRFRLEIGEDPTFAVSRLVLNESDRDLDPGLSPVVTTAPGMRARYLRFTALALRRTPGEKEQWFFCLGEILAFANGVDVIRHQHHGPVVEASPSSERRPQWSVLGLTDGITGLGLPLIPGEPRFNGWSSSAIKDADGTRWVQIDLGSEWPIDEVRLMPMHHPQYPDLPTFGFPSSFQILVAQDGDPDFIRQPKVYYQVDGKDYPDPGLSPLPLQRAGISGRYVRILAQRMVKSPWDFRFALAEVEVWSGGRNVAAGRPVNDQDISRSDAWTREALTDGLASGGRLERWDVWLAGLDRRRRLSEEVARLEQLESVALATAHRRGTWIASGLAAALGGAGIYGWWRARRARRRELADLQDRIARDLHDELGSHLGSITLMSGLALRPGGDPAAAMADVHRLSREAAASMRGIIWLVREEGRPPLSRLGTALRQTVDLILRGCDCTLRVEGQPPDAVARLDVHRHIYLFFREVAHNIARHAKAGTVTVELTWNDRRLVLAVTDDGRGFDPANVVPGSGLANLRHRADQLGGTVVIDSAPGSGTRIRLEAPIP